MQHLGGFFKKIYDIAEKQKTVDLFWQATHEKHLTIGGTGLIAMSNNVDSPGLDREAVSARALQLSEDPTCGELTKITVLQICAKQDAVVIFCLRGSFVGVRVLEVAHRPGEVAITTKLGWIFHIKHISEIGWQPRLGTPSSQ